MGWTLLNGKTPVAHFEQVDIDMPWFVCRFAPAAEFDEFRPMFAAQERAMASEDWDAAERVWQEMFRHLSLVSDDPTEGAIKEFLIRLDEDNARLRYEPT